MKCDGCNATNVPLYPTQPDGSPTVNGCEIVRWCEDCYNAEAWDKCPGCGAEDGWNCDMVDVRDPATYARSCGGAA